MTGLIRRILLVTALTLASIVIAQGVVLAAVTKSGGAVTAVRTATADDLIYLPPGGWLDVPGMQVSINVPDGQRAMLLISLSASASCYRIGGDTSNWCSVRALVDGNVAAPGQALLWDNSMSDQMTASTQWMVTGVRPGTHVVKIQYSQPNTFYMRNRILTVMRSRQ
jgi:hypothetical protein